MTPRQTSHPDTAACFPRGGSHLTEDQFGELLAPSMESARSPNASAEAHLLTCHQCAAELSSLRESISLFRQASNAYADNELRRMPQVSLPARPMFSPVLESAYWAAAAAIVLAAFLPMQFLRQHSLPPVPSVPTIVADRPAQSDEALLDDVNREISASVPIPMQALDDPTDAVASVDTDTSLPTSTQRKD